MTEQTAKPPVSATREKWVRPELFRMDAADAEMNISFGDDTQNKNHMSS